MQRIAFPSLAEAERFGWEIIEELEREGAGPQAMEVVDDCGRVVRVLRHPDWR